MVILLTGASGFIGKRLCHALAQAGHVVVEARRDAIDGAQSAHVDFTKDLDARAWLPKLAGIEAVINTVGIVREHGEQTFERIHVRAAQALFAACAAAGVRRVVQISALGADEGTTRYFSSKRAADDYLRTLPLDWVIVQPALVYGPGGTSARLFTMLASMPIVPLPGPGEQRIQPIYVDDLVEAIVHLVSLADVNHERIPLAGPQPLTLRDYLGRLRAAMGLGAARFISIPMWIMRASACAGAWMPRSLLDSDTLEMLSAGNVADPSWTQRLLGRTPRPPESFIPPDARSCVSTEARLAWLLPMLRISIALMWIWTGIVSLGVYPREDSYELLGRVGIGAPLAPLLLYGAALLDLALGVATLLLSRRRLLWLLQMALIAGYSVIVSIELPEFWLHPYGPILKNVPVLAAIYLLYSLEPRR